MLQYKKLDWTHLMVYTLNYTMYYSVTLLHVIIHIPH